MSPALKRHCLVTLLRHCLNKLARMCISNRPLQHDVHCSFRFETDVYDPPWLSLRRTPIYSPVKSRTSPAHVRALLLTPPQHTHRRHHYFSMCATARVARAFGRDTDSVFSRVSPCQNNNNNSK